MFRSHPLCRRLVLGIGNDERYLPLLQTFQPGADNITILQCERDLQAPYPLGFSVLDCSAVYHMAESSPFTENNVAGSHNFPVIAQDSIDTSQTTYTNKWGKVKKTNAAAPSTLNSQSKQYQRNNAKQSSVHTTPPQMSLSSSRKITKKSASSSSDAAAQAMGGPLLVKKEDLAPFTLSWKEFEGSSSKTGLNDALTMSDKYHKESPGSTTVESDEESQSEEVTPDSQDSPGMLNKFDLIDWDYEVRPESADAASHLNPWKHAARARATAHAAESSGTPTSVSSEVLDAFDVVEALNEDVSYPALVPTAAAQLGSEGL